MRTRRTKKIDRLADLAAELFEVMYDEMNPESADFWRESRNPENCIHFGGGCPENCKSPVSCKRFLFKKGHKFERFNEVLHL